MQAPTLGDASPQFHEEIALLLPSKQIPNPNRSPPPLLPPWPKATVTATWMPASEGPGSLLAPRPVCSHSSQSDAVNICHTLQRPTPAQSPNHSPSQALGALRCPILL